MSSRTASALLQAGRPLRRRLLGVGAVAPLAAFAATLAVGAWAIRVGALRSPRYIPLAWGLGLAVSLLVLRLVAIARRRVTIRGLAATIESTGGRAGALQGLLEPPAEGTSAGLRGAADQRGAEAVAARAGAALQPELERLGRVFLIGVGAFVLALLLLGAAGSRGGRAALLWQPGRALALLASPLRVSVDRAVVDLGDSVNLAVSAPGRQQVWLWTRSPGTSWIRQELLLDSTGLARRSVGPLREAFFAHVTAGGRSSDTIAVTVRRPAFLASLSLTVRYPAYLGMEDEPVSLGPDTLLIPAGSRVELKGEATVPLGGAEWDREGLRIPLRVQGTWLEGGMTPGGSGAYRLRVRTQDGGLLPGDELSLILRVMPDAAPEVEIPVPAGDTVAPASGSVPLVLDVRDDHGLVEVALERRLTRGGKVQALPDEGLPLPGSGLDRAILPAAVDPALLQLLPGDTLTVVARARDNSPARQVGRSREVKISMPTRPELRAEGREKSADLGRQLDSLVAESRRAQREAEDLGRMQQRERASERSGTPSGELDFDGAKKAQAVAERQEELLKDAEAARRALDELRANAERAGLADSVFLQRLREVREELERAMSPELRQKLAELQEALRALDRERTRSAVQNLSEVQQKLREALERSRELFKRAALEGELASLEQESKELASEQRDWNAALASADSARAAWDERALAQRADSVAKGLTEAARQLEAEERRDALTRAADTARAAANQMRQAAQAAERSRTSQARQSGEQAAGKMGKVQQEVQEQREAQQQDWREEIVAQLDRALLETTRLAERQLGIAEQLKRGSGTAATRTAQGAAEEAAQKLLEQVAAASGKNALVSPQIIAALAEARQQMRRAREAAASVSGNSREAAQSAGEAVDALNVAAYGLLRSREDVSGASSGSGFAEAMQRMTQLANRQGQLSQDASGLLPQMGAAAAEQQLQALAARQRELAQALERLRAQGQTDAKPLGDEAGELARQMERGRLDRDIVARQERLFRRMLDAGRTLQGHEEDERKERQSETAKPGQILLPPALRDRLLREAIRLPGWDELQRLSPEERRLVTDYFRRLSGGVP
jgi:hypothetical protein